MLSYATALRVVVGACLAALAALELTLWQLTMAAGAPLPVAADPAVAAAPEPASPPAWPDGAEPAEQAGPTARAAAEARGVPVVGRVVARASGEPVPMAAVTLAADPRDASRPAPAPPDPRLHGIADASGRFRFAVAPGRYVLEASAPGFSRSRLPVTAPAEVDVALGAAAVVEGIVRAADGTPGAGAEVVVAGADELARDIAGPSGGFAVEVPPGTYSVTARGDRGAGAWPAPVTVAAGGRARGIQIRLGWPGAIAGAVVGEDGVPVRRATVTVSPHEGAGELSRGDTDASGRFSVEPLGAGTYDVAIAAAGWAPAVRGGIALLAGERAELAIALKRASGVVEGTITDDRGRAAVAVRVTLAGAARGAPRAEARTDAAGRYRLAGLAAGRVEVSAARDDAASGASSSVEVGPGAVARLDLTLPETGVLEGVVLRGDRGPVGRAVVVVRPRGAAFAVAQVDVERDGAYRVRLPAGEWAASAAAGDGRGAAPFEPPSLVHITPGQASRLDLHLGARRGGAASPAVVRVVEPDGSGSPGALVLVTTADDLRGAGSAVTDGEGFARVDLAEEGGLLVRALRGGGVGGPVPLAEGGQTVVALRAAARLRGRVVALDGPPVAGFGLELAALGDDASVAATVGGAAGVKSARGVQAPRRLEFGGERFEVAEVPAGPVRVLVHTPSGRWGRAEVELAPGELRELEVALEPGATVDGRVVDARDRAPLAGAALIVLGQPDAGARPEMTTGADGRFHLTGFPAGTRRLRVAAAGYAPAEREAELAPGAVLELGDVALAVQDSVRTAPAESASADASP